MPINVSSFTSLSNIAFIFEGGLLGFLYLVAGDLVRPDLDFRDVFTEGFVILRSEKQNQNWKQPTAK